MAIKIVASLLNGEPGWRLYLKARDPISHNGMATITRWFADKDEALSVRQSLLAGKTWDEAYEALLHDVTVKATETPAPTSADRELAQDWVMRGYLRERKLDARAQWERDFQRDNVTGIVRARVHSRRSVA